MIKKIEIQNVFGIKNKQVLNFETKNLKESQIDFENGIVKENNYKLMLTPTLIGRNAIGKTSLLKAIEFSDKINSINDLLNIFFINIEKELEKIDYIISREL
jgi:AAA15 family ATPase/GTPase